MKPPNVTTGLILGKFAPFHMGHQLLFDTALKEVHRVLAVIYDSPQVTSIPLNVRANWIRELYPSVEVIEGWDGPPETGDTPEIRSIQEKYILRILKQNRISHFYSSEFYGEHMSRALGAINRVIDAARTHVPISATQIRENPFKYRQFLSPVVYRDHIVNVVFLGAPSTGKSTLAEHLARSNETLWMPEFGREYWEKNHVNRRLSIEQLVEIAEGHIAREDQLLLNANRVLFSDTNAITTYMFSLSYHGMAHQRLQELVLLAEKRYDLCFLCDTDIPYDDTWDRSGELSRETFQRQIVADLQSRRVPYFLVRGSLEQRAGFVQFVLSRYRKFSSIASITNPSGGI